MAHLRLGELKGSPTSEFLPHLGEEKLSLSKAIHLGDPVTAGKCCFSCCIVFLCRMVVWKIS